MRLKISQLQLTSSCSIPALGRPSQGAAKPCLNLFFVESMPLDCSVTVRHGSGTNLFNRYRGCAVSFLWTKDLDFALTWYTFPAYLVQEASRIM